MLGYLHLGIWRVGQHPDCLGGYLHDRWMAMGSHQEILDMIAARRPLDLLPRRLGGVAMSARSMGLLALVVPALVLYVGMVTYPFV